MIIFIIRSDKGAKIEAMEQCHAKIRGLKQAMMQDCLLVKRG